MWFGLFGVVFFGSVWCGFAWGVVCFGSVRSGLVWWGLVWCGLSVVVRCDLVWLVWYDIGMVLVLLGVV